MCICIFIYNIYFICIFQWEFPTSICTTVQITLVKWINSEHVGESISVAQPIRTDYQKQPMWHCRVGGMCFFSRLVSRKET